MRTVILCGGLGTRLSEETVVRPKPMVEVGGKPILWHILKCYSHFGFNDFVLALGYKGEVIKDYFVNYRYRATEISVDTQTNEVKYIGEELENWRVLMSDTGDKTMTGGRLHRLEKSLRSEGTFMMTYGDGVCDIDVRQLLKFHQEHGRIATMTAVRPPARFGTMKFDGDVVVDFQEKPQAGEGWINGGFFVFEPQIFDYLSGDQTILEAQPLENLARDRQLVAFRHEGYWQCMDTLRDKQVLNEAWASEQARWKVWS